LLIKIDQERILQTTKTLRPLHQCEAWKPMDRVREKMGTPFVNDVMEAYLLIFL
jgi:hypothetical protein